MELTVLNLLNRFLESFWTVAFMVIVIMGLCIIVIFIIWIFVYIFKEINEPPNKGN